MAPEYFMHGITHEKTDVFAFGVLLLELITGRRAVNSDGQSLVKWVCFESLLISFSMLFLKSVFSPCTKLTNYISTDMANYIFCKVLAKNLAQVSKG